MKLKILIEVIRSMMLGMIVAWLAFQAGYDPVEAWVIATAAIFVAP